MSQSALAKAVGITRPAVSLFLNGKDGLKLATLDKLLDYFGMELTLRPKSTSPSAGGSPSPPPEAEQTPAPPEEEGRTSPPGKEAKPVPASFLFQEPRVVDVPEGTWTPLRGW